MLEQEKDAKLENEKFDNTSFIPGYISLFLIRSFICIVIGIIIVFLKLKQPNLFNYFKNWYINNVCEQLYYISDIKENILNNFFAIVVKVSNIIKNIFFKIE